MLQLPWLYSKLGLLTYFVWSWALTLFLLISLILLRMYSRFYNINIFIDAFSGDISSGDE